MPSRQGPGKGAGSECSSGEHKPDNGLLPPQEEADPLIKVMRKRASMLQKSARILRNGDPNTAFYLFTTAVEVLIESIVMWAYATGVLTAGDLVGYHKQRHQTRQRLALGIIEVIRSADLSEKREPMAYYRARSKAWSVVQQANQKRTPLEQLTQEVVQQWDAKKLHGMYVDWDIEQGKIADAAITEADLNDVEAMARTLQWWLTNLDNRDGRRMAKRHAQELKRLVQSLEP